ncbi:transglutaminase family protein [Pleomorphomonas sp. NRK KF1]|uniref:transglutaminase family protein n=1 Tax=Pleomorphomonas sp. NRK KF1 TaxID=2943000 RepID=UPI002043C32B|nr:transglutaminase family protein [Pleomorphomonas sp. NRK KF1]MCM5554304.1 transglutaminase family protein [Pleomorphomonas sp. NRK KF1]
MIYELRQQTRYAYAAAVPYSSHVARLLPVDRKGQTVRKAMLSIAPMPSERRETLDFFGNRICHFALDRPHDELVVRLEAEVEVRPVEPYLAALTPSADEVRTLAVASRDLGPDSPVHGLFVSPSVPLDAAITRYAAQSFSARRSMLEGAIELMKRIKGDFAYVLGATDADTRPSDAFAARKGVCQDFAHVMIAGLRGIALPARYVSGYLRTEPPPGKERLEGADATHAWVEVWCGGEAGWVGLDPTNGIMAGEDHLVLAIGRDYSDVSPLDGVIVASGAHSLTVAVDVIPLPGPSAKRLLRVVE